MKLSPRLVDVGLALAACGGAALWVRVDPRRDSVTGAAFVALFVFTLLNCAAYRRGRALRSTRHLRTRGESLRRHPASPTSRRFR